MTKQATVWKPQSGQGDATSISDTFLITELGDFLVTESLDFLILEPSVVTPKASTIWGLTDTKAGSTWRLDGSGDFNNGATATRTTISGDARTVIGGESRITSDSTYTPKSGSIWSEA